MRPQEIDKKTKYIQDLFGKEDDLLREIRLSTKKQAIHMQIGPDESKILSLLISLINAEKIVEIGTLAGYSAICMARTISENGKIYTCEKSKEAANWAKENFQKANVEDKINLLIGDALESLKLVENEGPFDMVFIDADKISYPKYLDWAEKSIRKGGLVIGDNTFLFGTVYEDEIPEDSNVRPTTHKAMQQFNERLSDTQKYMSVLIPTLEGMTIAQKLF